ncbi:hypothetical protein L227DRAFT_136680 [Lentinus tigrinus ALCF2SS1-6]|uniref:Uncharacterized protein n=1 Tax=Lentinus tigrinus ALCF2SS1-6 TaxID=1328759 RepID=A0A5C2SSV8_9APHY|nr:hypothetical protein L227DRAFT_136680 [Lentinus tigrinus ALCF2SS1-6]
MTPLDLALLGLNANDAQAAVPSPHPDLVDMFNNALRVDLSSSCENKLHMGHTSRPLLASDALWHAQSDVDIDLVDNFLATLTFSPDPDMLGLPQRHTPREVCAASTILSLLVSDSDAFQAFPTDAETMLYAPRLPTSCLPYPLQGSDRALDIQPTLQHGGGQAAGLCIAPALLHTPSTESTIAEAYPAPVIPAPSQGMARRSSRKGRASGVGLPEVSYCRTHPTTPYASLSRFPSVAPADASPSSTLIPTPQPAPPNHVPEVIICPRRNVAASSELASPPTDPWKCPHCPYVQVSHRKADLDRHIETHTSPREAKKALWVCCGAPLWDVLAGKYSGRFPDKAIWDAIGEEPFYFQGFPMVGGCKKAFSREDALRRHLHRRRELCCLGDAKGDWQPGNRCTQD